MTIEWTRFQVAGLSGAEIMRGRGKSVEWTVMPSVSRLAPRCEIKVRFLDAQRRSDEETHFHDETRRDLKALRDGGKDWEAHRYGQMTSVTGWEIGAAGGEIEAVAAIEAMEAGFSGDRPTAMLAKAGFVKVAHFGSGPAAQYEKRTKSGWMTLIASKNGVMLRYEPRNSHNAHMLFTAFFGTNGNRGRRLTHVSPTALPFRSALAAALTIADLRLKSHEPSRRLAALEA